MDRSKSIVAVQILFAIFSSGNSFEVSLEFANINLTEIPFNEILYNVTKLNLSHNSISSLESNIFENNTEIVELYLNNNSISYISPMAFSGTYNKLEVLYLQDNSLTEFPDLRNVSTLKSLQLQNNLIRTLNEEYLDLRMLEFLNLDKNNLTEFNQSFQLMELKEIKISWNQLTKLPSFYYELPGLKLLHFGHNAIQDQLNCEFFQKFPNLTNLCVDGNRLIQVEICGAEELETLSLENNNLTTVPILIETLLNLKYLFIGSNPITFIQDDYFSKLPNLVEFYLSSTHISVLFDISGLPNLRVLIMDNCRFHTIGNTLNISGLGQLETLSLKNNNFSVAPILNNELTNLEKLFIDSNPISIIEDDYFNETPNLVELGMSNTDISDLFHLSPLALLKKLDVSNCLLTTVSVENLKNLKQLKTLDLSSNLMHRIPNMVEVASAVMSSKLSVSFGRESSQLF